MSLGGRIVRNDLAAVLDGEGAHATIDGVYVADGTQLVDNHTSIDHATPHCTSHELYKGILAGKARAVFNGRILVRPDAQKTDAKQTNRALLLSDEAQVNSNPQLEIFADDVKCTHGAAVGQLDEDALFYLQARGLPPDQARDLLLHAFAARGARRHLVGRAARPARGDALRPARTRPGRRGGDGAGMTPGLPSPAALPVDVAQLRAQFPILSESAHGHPLVYLDNAATTQKPRVVLDAIARYYESAERQRPSRRPHAVGAGHRGVRGGAHRGGGVPRRRPYRTRSSSPATPPRGSTWWRTAGGRPTSRPATRC